MSRAFVHLGLHKTGTTAFQAALLDRAEDLRRHGVAVVSRALPGHGLILPTNAIDLANVVLRADLDTPLRRLVPESALSEFRAVGDRALAEAVGSPAPTLVASSENLSLLRTREEVARLEAVLHPRRVHAVVVVRDPKAWQDSFRRHQAGAGIPTWSFYPSSCSNLRDDSWLLDHQALVDVLRAGLGPDRVTVLDYDRELAAAGSIVPALWRACDLPDDLLGVEVATALHNVSHRAGGPVSAPDGADELEWLRDRVARQAAEIARLRWILGKRWSVRVAQRLRWLVRTSSGGPSAPRDPGPRSA